MEPDAPDVKHCEEDAAGIFFSNPTGRAEIMIVLTGRPPVAGKYKLWKQFGSGTVVRINEEARHETVRFLGYNQDRIYWNISPNLLKDAYKEMTLWLSWEWKDRIKEGQCSSQSNQTQS